MNELHKKAIALLQSQGLEQGEFGLWFCGKSKQVAIALNSEEFGEELSMALMGIDGTAISISSPGEVRSQTILKSWCYLIKAIDR